MHFTKFQKSGSEGCTRYASNCMTFQKRQNQRDSTKISVSQELGVAGWGLNKWSPEDF